MELLEESEGSDNGKKKDHLGLVISLGFLVPVLLGLVAAFLSGCNPAASGAIAVR